VIIQIVHIAFPLTAIAIFACSYPVSGQGTFDNLDFESGNPGSITFSSSVPVSSVLPDWTATIDGVQQTDVGYNYFPPGPSGPAGVSLIGPGGAWPALDGTYSVLLTGGTGEASISQTAVIPMEAQSLTFEVEEGLEGRGSLAVSIGGQSLSLLPLATEPNYTLYGTDISAWAGAREDLTFEASAGFPLTYWEIDDISFSPTAVPEPTPIALTGIGGIALALSRGLLRNLQRCFISARQVV
jgi:hypothetical protein